MQGPLVHGKNFGFSSKCNGYQCKVGSTGVAQSDLQF